MDLSEDARSAIIDDHFVLIGFIAASPELFAPPSGTHVAPPDGLLRIFAVVLGMFILAGWAFGALTIYVGRCIKRRARRTLTVVVACLNTLFIPVGTVLGVFTPHLVAPSGACVIASFSFSCRWEACCC